MVVKPDSTEDQFVVRMGEGASDDGGSYRRRRRQEGHPSATHSSMSVRRHLTSAPSLIGCGILRESRSRWTWRTEQLSIRATVAMSSSAGNSWAVASCPVFGSTTLLPSDDTQAAPISGQCRRSAIALEQSPSSGGAYLTSSSVGMCGRETAGFQVSACAILVDTRSEPNWVCAVAASCALAAL